MARSLLRRLCMRVVVFLLAAVSIAGAVLNYVRREPPTAAKQEAKAPVAQPSATREPSEHNWPKRALDRAADVRRQVTDQRKQDEPR